MVNSSGVEQSSRKGSEILKPESLDESGNFVHNCNEIERVLINLLEEVQRIKNRAQKFNTKFQTMKMNCQSLDKINSMLEAELKIAENETRHLRNENDLLKKKLKVLLDRAK